MRGDLRFRIRMRLHVPFFLFDELEDLKLVDLITSPPALIRYHRISSDLPFPKMARKLALLFVLMHSLQILALPTPYENSIAFKSLTSTNTYNNRYYFPETLPDQDELTAMLKETAMREAGFVPSSNGSPSNPKPKSMDQKMETETELRKSPDTDMETAIGTDASGQSQPDWHTTQNTKLRQSQAQSQSRSRLKESIVAAFASDNYPINWPPFGFFVVSAAIVCFFTVLRGIRAKK
ncbi:unnamed protein product [Penicillium palitans]